LASLPEALPEPDSRAAPARLGVLFAAVVMFGLAHSGYFLLPKYLAVALHADASQIGLYASVTWLANVLCVPFVAVAIDRYGRLRFAFAGTALMAVTCFGFLAVDRLGPLLFALRVVHGLAFTCFFISTQTLAADLARPERLARVLGYYGSGFVVTNAIAPAAAEWLAARAGWHAMFWTTAAMSLVTLVLLAFVRERGVKSRSDSREVPGIGSALARPGFLRVMAVSSLAGVTFAAAFTFHQPFALSLGIERVSDFLVAYSIAAVVARGPFGALADRAGRVRVTRFALVVYTAAAAAMPALAHLGLVFTGAAFGVAHGLFYPALNAFALEGARADVRGKVTGLFNGAFNVGFSLGSLGLGHVALAAGYGPLYAIGAVCSLAALALLPKRAPEEGVT
jgi:predicted MFS family arabinose efflux permease